MRTKVVSLQSVSLVIFSAEDLGDEGTSSMSALDPAIKSDDECVLSLSRIYASSAASVGCASDTLLILSAATCFVFK
jgi:hypothetical protein